MKGLFKKGNYFLLAAALLLGVAGAFSIGADPAPVSVHAEPNDHDWVHDTEGEALNTQTSELTEGKKYYLDSDLQLTSGLTIIGNVELCLNGYTLTLNSEPINVGQGSTLTLYDCGGDDGTGVGTITGGSDGAIHVSYGTFTMNGGTISGNTVTGNGGGVSMMGGSFTMNGGTITQNTAQYGGGIYANSQQSENYSFTVTNGTIGENTAEHVDTDDRNRVSGGGIYVGEGTKIHPPGRHTVTGNNSGVYVREPNVSENAATLTVGEGATISNNTIGIELYGTAHLEMTSGTISGNGEFGIDHGGSGMAKNPATATISDGSITGNGVGIGEFEGKLTLANVRIAENIGIGVETTFLGGGQPSLEMTECTVENNGGAGITIGSVYTQPVPFTMQDGSVSGNKGGGVVVYGSRMGDYSAACTLTGAPTITDNTLNGAAANLILNGNTVSVAGLQGGEVGITPGLMDDFADLTAELPVPFFTVGYSENVASYLSYDGTDGGKFAAKQIESIDEMQAPVTATELVLVYHLSFMVDGVENETFSGDYDAGSYINTVFYDYGYDDQQQVVGTIKTEVEQLLVKEPDDTNHYNFSHFSNGQGEPYAFSAATRYRFTGETVVNAEFAATPHTWGTWQDDEDGEHHTRYCNDQCGATQQEAHNWGACTQVDENEHTHSCTDCQATATAPHDWGAWQDDGDGNTHSRTCNDECGATQQEAHNWGAWSSDDDNTHSRTCTDECGATQQEAHNWGTWQDDGDGEHHTHSCQTEGCDATQQEAHTWGAWSNADENNHTHTCSDCQTSATAPHDWGAWQDDGDGEHHTHTCQTAGCDATQQEAHSWQSWYETDGETWTRDCGDCAAQNVKADDRHVVAALRKDGGYSPCYTLQNAFESAERGQTVYLVRYEDGTELNETLLLNKNILLGAVTRTVGADFRASYSPTDAPVTLKRAAGFTGAMIEIARGTSVRFENLILESGAGTAVEVYGSLTVAGGAVGGTIRVRASGAQGVALLALTGDGTLALTNAPALGTIALDDPAGGIVPAVDLDGFTGKVTVEISENRPYGAFVTNVGSGAEIDVTGGERWQNGLSRREVRLQDGMYLCGGYDLTAKQTALGEVTLGGTCDEFLKELTVTVNGSALTLSADGGNFGAQAVETDFSASAEISVGGAQASLGLVSYDETSGLLTAPEGATFSKDGTQFPLNGADPFELDFTGDNATVTVDGMPLTLDFSRPVGAAFVYRYLTDDGVIFAEVDYKNYERIREAERVFGELTARQQGAVNDKLADSPFPSFEQFLNAVTAYLAAQNQKVDEFLDKNETVAKDFDSVTAEDKKALNSALDGYFEAGEEERHFLDETAKEEGYSGFEGMVEDLLAKSEFETEREETLENLGTILRGCDGTEVRQEFSLTIETVEGAVYERCTDDDLRLDYLVGRKEALATAVRVLETIRTEERAKSALDEYLLEKQQSGRYSEEALAQLKEIADASKSALSGIDPERADGNEAIEEILNDGLRRLDEVRALAVVSGEGTPSEVVTGSYPERTEKLLGYLTKGEGFRGDATLSLLYRPAEENGYRGLVALFGVTVQLSGDSVDGTTQVRLLLPANARGYTGYCVMSVSADGTPNGTTNLAQVRVASDGAFRNAQTDGNVLIFETDGSTEFVILAQKKVDLGWLMVLLGCLCGLETAALLYVAGYFIKNRAAAVAPVSLAAVILPASAVPVCAALGAVCLCEAVAIALLLALIRKREKSRRDPPCE